jgi:multiple sugar transport system permease protein
MTAYRARRRAVRGAQYGILTVFALIMAAPLIFVIYASLLTPPDYFHIVAPDQLTLQNYRYVLQHAAIGRWYLNTLFVTASVIVGAVIVNTMGSWALARFRFTGRQTVFLVVILILLVPIQAYLIPLYLQVVNLGWLNTYWSLIVPFLVNPLLIFLMRQYFSRLPNDLEEAAKIDGANRFKIFLRIGVPLTMTGIATQAILAGTWTWNGFLVPVTFINNPNYFVLTLGLDTLQAQNYTIPTVQMAGVVLLTLPVVVMFLIFQRFIVPSIASSGIKG